MACKNLLDDSIVEMYMNRMECTSTRPKLQTYNTGTAILANGLKERSIIMRILLLDLDSTRPDHLGCYGYPRQTSPNIDRIAAQGVRFDHYYTSDAPCFPSRTALMTGRFGIHNGVVGHGGSAADVRHEGPSREFRDRLAAESFPALFRQAGLRTALVSPFGERHSAWTFYAGFNEIYNTGKGGMESAEEVTPVVLD